MGVMLVAFQLAFYENMLVHQISVGLEKLCYMCHLWYACQWFVVTAVGTNRGKGIETGFVLNETSPPLRFPTTLFNQSIIKNGLMSVS
jgi:hypothetical protein